ncbi:MAG TPA: hypothetical protein PLR88_07965 [Bacteroidales bacterium]|nr:hypothetical protein [Bacteroidales bacterium]
MKTGTTNVIILTNHVETRCIAHRVSTKSQSKCANENSFGPQSKNLASIMRKFKSAVTIRARKIDNGFSWQSKFYDHIIRTDIELFRIRNYIRNNPDKWNC